ncbi:hypothetical protein D4764_09G0004330 [Takifugu flavidus]|uniref:Interleukin-6 n=1 Tax=Takifugu flavidus TaxID=433684 RepID=A0A5C6MJK9_9TELE|nr:hypothetical protein D4764_09G0004330 [Takifugu flavidus]
MQIHVTASPPPEDATPISSPRLLQADRVILQEGLRADQEGVAVQEAQKEDVLRAAPFATPHLLSMEALGFELLDGITCEKEKDLNLTSPKNVEDNCYNAALGHYIREFKRTAASCPDAENIETTLEELERIYSKTQTACTLTMKTHATFEGFVNATEAFAQQYNSYFQRK